MQIFDLFNAEKVLTQFNIRISFPGDERKGTNKKHGSYFHFRWRLLKRYSRLTINQLLEDLVKNLVFLYVENFNTQKHSTNKNLERKS